MPTFDRVALGDNANVDAFSRLRVSPPSYLFDAQFTYDLQPLLFQQLTNGSGATVTYDSTNRCALMTTAATPNGGYAYMQSYAWVPYQPGRSQLFIATFNFIAAAANTLKFVGLGDGTNGIQFELNGSTLQFSCYSGTTGGSQTFAQSAWNIDRFDGTRSNANPSGIKLDITKTQILVIDYQALYAGRVRVGFCVDGVIYYAHQFAHANIFAYSYIQNANLPVRAGMTCSGASSTTMNFICSSVTSEGGQLNYSGYVFSQEGTGTAGSGAVAQVLSLQPATTFNSIATRVDFTLLGVDVVVTGTNPVRYDVVVGQALSSPSWTAVNATYSAFQYATGATLTGSAAATIVSGYCAPSNGVASKQFLSLVNADLRYPITLDASGANITNGSVTVLGYGLGGTSAMRATLTWIEVR